MLSRYYRRSTKDRKDEQLHMLAALRWSQRYANGPTTLPFVAAQSHVANEIQKLKKVRRCLHAPGIGLPGSSEGRRLAYFVVFAICCCWLQTKQQTKISALKTHYTLTTSLRDNVTICIAVRFVDDQYSQNQSPATEVGRFMPSLL